MKSKLILLTILFLLFGFKYTYADDQYNFNAQINYDTNEITITASNIGTGSFLLYVNAPDNIQDYYKVLTCDNTLNITFTTAKPQYGFFKCGIKRFPSMISVFQYDFAYDPPYLMTLDKPLINIGDNGSTSAQNGVINIDTIVNRNTDLNINGKLITALYDGDKMVCFSNYDLLVDNFYEIKCNLICKNYQINKDYTLKVFAWSQKLNNLNPISNIMTKNIIFDN